MNTVAVQSNLANLEHAFYVAEKIGVIRLLDPEGELFPWLSPALACTSHQKSSVSIVK